MSSELPVLFLTLPLEIRYQIYDSYFSTLYIVPRVLFSTSIKRHVFSNPAETTDPNVYQYRQQLSFLQTCKQTNIEATPYFYRGATFALDLPKLNRYEVLPARFCSAHRELIDRLSINGITKLSLQFCGSPTVELYHPHILPPHRPETWSSPKPHYFNAPTKKLDQLFTNLRSLSILWDSRAPPDLYDRKWSHVILQLLSGMPKLTSLYFLRFDPRSIWLHKEKEEKRRLRAFIAWLKQQIAEKPVKGPNRRLSITCSTHRYPFTPFKEAIGRSPLP